MISIPTSLNREPGKFVAEPLRDDVQILIQQQIHLVLRYHSLNVFEHNQKIRITVKVALRSWDSLRVYLLRGHCLVSIVSFFFFNIYFYYHFIKDSLLFGLAERSLRHAGPQLHGQETVF